MHVSSHTLRPSTFLIFANLVFLWSFNCRLSLLVKSHLRFLSEELPVLLIFFLDLYRSACFPSLTLTIPWGLLGLQPPSGSLVGGESPLEQSWDPDPGPATFSLCDLDGVT